LNRSKVGVVAHNKKLVKDAEVEEVVNAARNLRTNPTSFVAKVKKLQRKHIAITIVILCVIAGGIFGWKTATAKAVAASVLQKVHRSTQHAKTLVDDLYTRIFRKISKREVEEAAKKVAPSTLAKAFHYLWPKITAAALVVGSGAALAQRPELLGKMVFMKYNPHVVSALRHSSGLLKTAAAHPATRHVLRAVQILK
jgi:chorismate mutase